MDTYRGIKVQIVILDALTCEAMNKTNYTKATSYKPRSIWNFIAKEFNPYIMKFYCVNFYA